MKRIPPVDVYKRPPTAMDEYLPEEPPSGTEKRPPIEKPSQRPVSVTTTAPTGPNPPIKSASQLLDDDFRVEDTKETRRAPRGAPPDDTVQISIWLGPTERRLLALERMRRTQVPKRQRPSKEKLTTSALVREAVRRCFGDGENQ